MITDKETWCGEHPSEALERYRKVSKVNARLAVLATSASASTIADPRDPLQLDFVGFDSHVPALLSQFLREVL